MDRRAHQGGRRRGGRRRELAVRAARAQGPGSARACCSRSPASTSRRSSTTGSRTARWPACAATVSRTGYTGEDGFEIFVPPQLGRSRLAGAARGRTQRRASIPCGLGARDTLRLEAAMRLLRQRHRRDDHRRSKRTRLDRRLEEGRVHRRRARCASRRPTGVDAQARRLRDARRAASRATATTRTSAAPTVGVVTSGTQTPFLKKAIGMAYVPVAHAARRHRVRRRHPRPPRTRARVVPMPFYKRTK